MKRRQIIRIISLGLLFWLLPLVLFKIYQYYFDTYELQLLLSSQGAISREQYKEPIPKILPDDFKVIIESEHGGKVNVSFYYDNGVIYSYLKDKLSSNIHQLKMKQQVTWFHVAPKALSGTLILIALVLYMLRTGKFIMIGVSFSSIEAEFIIYSVVVLFGYFLFV
ncbi:MAG: hypothetical protein KZQ82_16450 [Candidatus Thiodiazotropha sp. (ex Lucinoma annulata)]|nr:hypothetical protein [Candidatus Thiodiazotropha sp. (ex Lucinoma annulata)]